MSAEVVISRLDAVKQTGSGRWLARCPAHEDRHASLSIRELEDGRVLIHDFAGCHVDEVLSAIGMSVSDLFPPREAVRYGRQPRSGIHPMDALAALAHEARIVFLAARAVETGGSLNEEDHARLGIAVGRISAALGVVHG